MIMPMILIIIKAGLGTRLVDTRRKLPAEVVPQFTDLSYCELTKTESQICHNASGVNSVTSLLLLLLLLLLLCVFIFSHRLTMAC